MGGLVEAEETYFLRSVKGQRKGLPRPAKKRGMPAAQRGLSLEPIPVLTAPSRSAPQPPQKKNQGMLHLNNINAYPSRLKVWMGRFRGIASRTLANYLGGRRRLDAARQTLTPQKFLAASGG